MNTANLIAIIHFLGLALFSTQVPGEEGALRVLLPRIEQQQHQQHQTVNASMTSGSSDAVMMRTIEPHVAALIFKEKDLLQEINWESEPVPDHMLQPFAQKEPWRLVRLDGESITFKPSAENAPVTRTALALPKPSCATQIARKIDVAATVNVPAGKLSSCKAPGRNRYDAVLTLANQKVITVWADSDSQSKALVLDGGASVYVVNIPVAVMDKSLADETMNAAHYLAYYSLLRTRPQRDCSRSLVPPAEKVSECDPIPVNVAGIADIRVVDSECSNSSWP
jgi:hypothetical protein